jgi:hypothetical protein
MAMILANIAARGEDKGDFHEDEHFFGDGSLRNVWELCMEL